eukprot:6468077-Amphidinium_carterae.1
MASSTVNLVTLLVIHMCMCALSPRHASVFVATLALCGDRLHTPPTGLLVLCKGCLALPEDLTLGLSLRSCLSQWTQWTQGGKK